jgi:site-specific DNA recombinase
MSDRIAPPTVLATPGDSTLRKGAQLMSSFPQTPKRAALYARVSTDEQAERGYSLPEQIRDLTRHASSKGWHVIGEPVVDDGYTGRSMNRPGLHRLREMANKGEIDIICVRKWDRLFRRSSHQDIFILEMQGLGVDVVSLDGQDHKTPEGKLFNRIQADFAEYFRDQIIANMRQGKQGRARAGKIVPSRSAPLGFAYDPEIGNYRVVPEKMAITRRIFEDVGVKGHSMWSVKLALEADGIKPPGYELALAAGKEPPKYWSISTIRRIIENDVYLGTQWYNRKRVEKNPDASGEGEDIKYRVSPNPIGDWIAVSVPDSGIPKEWIESARTIVGQNIKPTNKGRRPWELKGHVFCECGVRMTTHVTTRKGGKYIHYYYLCSRRRHNGKEACAYARYHRAEELEHRVERVILDLIRRPEIMLEHIEREVETRRNEAADSAAQRAMWQEQLQKIERKRSGFQDMTAEGLITFAESRTKLDALEGEADRVRKEITSLSEPHRAIQELEAIPATIEQYIAELPEIIHSDSERKSSHLKEIYRKLNLEVLARKSGELIITGAFGKRELEPRDPGPFIGMKATLDLDSEAYTWTEIPPPDSESWDTWKEENPVIWIRKKLLSSRYAA